MPNADARVAFMEHVRRDNTERGLTISKLAEKHQISESSVRTLLDPNCDPTKYEIFKVVLKQLGTEHSTVITVLAPAGTTYKQVVEQIRRNS